MLLKCYSAFNMLGYLISLLLSNYNKPSTYEILEINLNTLCAYPRF